MISRVTITPKFNSKRIIDQVLRTRWFTFQARAFDLGKYLHAYIQNYINARRKRRGSTGNLANSIDFHVQAGAGMGRIFWGIGYIPSLQKSAPYWYVVNYGKMVNNVPFVPNKGNFVPGSFEGTSPNPALQEGVQKFNFDDGTGYGMRPKNPIRPMNYISATKVIMNRQFRTLLLNLKKGK